MAEDFGPGRQNPLTIPAFANSFVAFRLLSLLAEKGILSQAEAASVMTAAADDVRSGTEDDKGEAVGEAVAKSFEQMAGWLLGHP